MGLEADVSKLNKRVYDLEKELEQLKKDHNTFAKWVQKEMGAVTEIESSVKSLQKSIK